MLSVKEQSILGQTEQQGLGGGSEVPALLVELWSGKTGLLRMPSLCPGPFLLCSGAFEIQTLG